MDSKKKTIDIVVLVLSSILAICALFGSIFTVVCSASKTFSWSSIYAGAPAAALKMNRLGEGASASKIYDVVEEIFSYKMSLVCILAFAAGVLAIGTLFWATMLYMKGKGKYAMFAIIISVATILVGLVPASTVCMHNCNLNNKNEELFKDVYKISTSANKSDDDNGSDYDDDDAADSIFGN